MKKGLVEESRTRCRLYGASKSILFNVISLPCTTIMVKLGFLTVLLQVNAISWEAASSTSTTSQTTSWLPIQTPKPTLITTLSSTVNHTYESPNICGWIDHNPDNSYTCGGSATCFWNSSLKLLGCGHATSIDYFTSCIPYKALQYCDRACVANPSIVRCGSDIPYCATPRVGPQGNYYILACQADIPFGTSYVYLAYKGQTTIGHLPRYLGADGIITYATHAPTISLLTAPSTTGANRSSFALEGAPVRTSSTYFHNPSSDCRSRPYHDGISDMSVVPQAAIVAGTIVGGLVVLCAIAGFIVLLVHRCRRRIPTADMQADLDMMPLEELEGRKTLNGRLYASSSLGSVVSQKE
ncbi:hypothetical protein OCU04_001965 [Sclerotinia nivalis]|uniref:Uncharacterized protein n=1 Tax=Sclerotinia nivalis TaxID=352851 RepID=A0A9X0AZ74_9HELO|nr:hypothetical protein OCU04_001965 [Sclerotinia nivalis]